MKKTTLIFYELHPINLLPILIASVFFRVVYWQSVFIPKWLQKRFEQIYQPGDFTQGEWGVKTASIFFQLKKIFPKNFYNKKYKDLNPQFIFAYAGYNLRSTELNAILGVNQLKSLNRNIKLRNRNHKIFLKNIDSNFWADYASGLRWRN